MLVQQAVFSSGHRRQREGFHLVGRTSGLTKADARLLVRGLPWCDALSPSDRQSTGTCFFELGDDSICISRSIRLSGGPVSRGLGGNDGAQLLTHCLVVPGEVFERFARNPFAILRAVSASGYVLSHEPTAGKLQPIRLAGRGPAVDHILLGNLTRHRGPAALAGLVREALEHERLILIGQQTEEILSGLMSVLPIDERAGFSFSIGLRPSLRRPMRVVAVPESSPQIERFARQCRYKLVKLSELAKVDYQDHAWASLVEEALEDANFSYLADQVMAPLASEIDGDAADEIYARGTGGAQTAAVQRAGDGGSSTAVLEPTAAGTLRGKTYARAAKSHRGGREATPAQRAGVHHDLAGNDPESLEMLERLDDLVYDAIAGQAGALDELSSFWPEAQAKLEGEALVESREQYVRYALGLWAQGETTGIQDPQRAMGALDVLCLLFPEGEF